MTGPKTKPISTSAVKLAEKSNHSFSVYLMNHFFQIFVLFNNVTMEFIELNSLCKYMKKVRSSQVSVSTNSCTELSKTRFFPESFVKLQLFLLID